MRTIVPAGAPWSGIVRRGQMLRITDLEGQQAVDFLCYNAADPQERYHAPNTMKAQMLQCALRIASACPCSSVSVPSVIVGAVTSASHAC